MHQKKEKRKEKRLYSIDLLRFLVDEALFRSTYFFCVFCGSIL